MLDQVYQEYVSERRRLSDFKLSLFLIKNVKTVKNFFQWTYCMISISIEVIMLGIFAKVSNLCWQGLTLKHISHKEIVIPYLLFVVMALLFELFLVALFSVSCFVFYFYGYSPDFVYYVSGAILLFILVITVSIIITIIVRHKMIFIKNASESSFRVPGD
ncbi:hypothetical protein [Neobacillus sp.]|uniref:hypothetical protein n=1 Tax=Neobacillus sp. TaxID=2675273 RepID=UPI00289CE4F3|nr:hypothetical protein [Neobacillus sp.]